MSIFKNFKKKLSAIPPPFKKTHPYTILPPPIHWIPGNK